MALVATQRQTARQTSHAWRSGGGALEVQLPLSSPDRVWCRRPPPRSGQDVELRVLSSSLGGTSALKETIASGHHA